MSKKLYVITNRRLLKDRSLEEVIEAAVRGGTDAVILREKDLSTTELYDLASKLLIIIDNRAQLIVNGNVSVSEKLSDTGIHLSFSSFMNSHPKSKGLMGVSIHSLEEAIKVDKKGADYIIAGHIYNTSCKDGVLGRGPEFLRCICDSLTIPVIAIGGISEVNVGEVMNCGAAGIAVMSSIMESSEVERTVYTLKNIMEKSIRV